MCPPCMAGIDDKTVQDDSHRREWIGRPMESLASVFAITTKDGWHELENAYVTRIFIDANIARTARQKIASAQTGPAISRVSAAE